MPATVVCFHKRRRCVHCQVGVGGTAPAAKKMRCDCCGRFVGKAITRCARCKVRGFIALHLFA